MPDSPPPRPRLSLEGSVKRQSVVLIPTLGALLALSAPALFASSFQDVSGIRTQWANSPHAMSMDEAGERERMNRTTRPRGTTR